MKIISNNTFLLRLAVSTILAFHALAGMFNGNINEFGQALNECDFGVCFAPLGVPIAWAIKLSHLACILSLLFDKYVRLTSLITIFILIMGIILIHGKKGWFVIGGTYGGMEFSFLLIFSLLTIMLPNGIKKTTIK